MEKMSRTNCPICMEDIHTSRIPSHIPSCGHLIHRTCFDELIRGGHYACPVCQTSMLNMESVWQYLDHEIAATPMPVEYRNYIVSILCRDCHKVSYSYLKSECKLTRANLCTFQFSEVAMHPLGAKCTSCGSYNTCRCGGPVNVTSTA